MLSFSLNAQSLGGLKSSRVDFGFLMGWDGLGTSPLSGMQTMDDNAYSTRPWFNSWQLEFTYNFVKAGDLKAFFGIGYESDVFRMDYDYVIALAWRCGQAGLCRDFNRERLTYPV